MPDATGLELIAAEIRDRFPHTQVDTHFQHGQATLIVQPEGLIETLKWLKQDSAHQYNFLASLHGADYLPQSPRFGVHYQLLNMERAERLCVKAVLDLPSDGQLPQLDSTVQLFPTADFQEREVYDMFGIHFKGHPNLTRILMPDGYQGWPQRRDFPIGGEPVQFSFNESEQGQ